MLLIDLYSLCLGLFLVNFEVTIVSTALVSIANDFNDFTRSSWVITAYLLTYTGKTLTALYCFSLLTFIHQAVLSFGRG